MRINFLVIVMKEQSSDLLFIPNLINLPQILKTQTRDQVMKS